MSAGDFGPPGARGESSTSRHADAARRTIALLLVAKRAGDDATAARLARMAARHVDRHLVGLRKRLP